MTLTFDHAVMTIVNHSKMPISSCAVNSAWELTPAFSPTMATVTGATFPITIRQNSVVGIQLDFNLDSSVQSDVSISPRVTVKHLTQRPDSDEEQETENVDEVDGQVTAVGSNQFRLMNEHSEQSFPIMVDSNMVFEDFDRSRWTANPTDFTCVRPDKFSMST
jgi:hypothetical protein